MSVFYPVNFLILMTLGNYLQRHGGVKHDSRNSIGDIVVKGCDDMVTKLRRQGHRVMKCVDNRGSDDQGLWKMLLKQGVFTEKKRQWFVRFH